ncbi:MAG: adenosylcobinamide-GDP ribazoletransferase [Anaerolineales bacterium]|nr:adenosylcobinamide-GDP ribazoletransferase [Anaerolineales bacterium]MCS7249155.1 adenosylcobinamide-GDP ribazoletransferase [Anaerolineales bacterium]MDW8162968.1 adenosylcobinamide-GDP ribazoletransferase [Anaerolineales bacterium]MDW8445885.1 adenosylcobinamide-GDP ribazoletransferase [Anaerolineales bacterium]
MDENSPQRTQEARSHLRRIWYAFWAAWQFLSILPPVVKRPFSAAEMGASLAFYPLVGLIFGVVLVVFRQLALSVFPPAVGAVFTLALWIGLSGALHLDGFLDACDGLLGGWTPEKRLEILRDEHHGAYALAGGVLLLLAKYSLLSIPNLPALALLLAPAYGRWGMVLAVLAFPYQRAQGAGRTLKEAATWREGLLATLWVLLFAGLGCAVQGWVALLGVLAVVWGGAKLTLRLIPGLTGDIYGALNELSELAVLVLFAAAGMG